MREAKEGRGGAASLVPLKWEEALGCRAAGKPVPDPVEPVVGIPPLPLPPVILPLPDAEALACFGGEGAGTIGDDVRELIRFITGAPPDPGHWPPEIG